MKILTSNKKRAYTENGYESLREGVGRELRTTGTAALDQFFKEFLKNTAEGIPKQLIQEKDRGKKKSSGELIEGQEVLLEQQQKQIQRKSERLSLHREYFRRNIEASEPLNAREEAMNARRIEDIQIQIKELIAASQEMEVAFREVSAQINTSSMKKPSNYEANFFNWVLLTIKNARARIEEGKNWLAIFASKKSQRQYWNMAKKHGTGFSLSSERNVATQTG